VSLVRQASRDPRALQARSRRRAERPWADPTVDDVLGLLGDNQNMARLVELLGGLDDKQRKKLSGPIQKHVEAHWLDRDGRSAAAVAVLGCVTGVRQVAARLDWVSVDHHSETAAVEVLRARQPHWLSALPEALLVGRERSPSSYRLVRALVREGMVESPEFPEYPLLMIHGVRAGDSWMDGPSVVDCLRTDPGLLDDELWRLFRTEGAGKVLALHDRMLLMPYERPDIGEAIPARPDHTWRHALITLADERLIDRSRLLDATLATFFRDWTPGDISWFVQLHDGVAPTLDEVAERQSTYARLLTVEPGHR
jgi:hypothetical protein